MGLTSNMQNSQLCYWFLPSEQNRPVANLLVVDFRSQPEEVPLPWIENVEHFAVHSST